MIAPALPFTEDVVRIVVPGEPCAQGRGRAFVHNATGRVCVADPKKSRSWKGAAQVHMREAMGERAPFGLAVRVDVLAVFSCPTSEFLKSRPRPRRWHSKARGDLDNVTKAVLDAGIGVLYLGDHQVVDLRLRKVIGAQGEAARVEIELRAAGDVDA